MTCNNFVSAKVSIKNITEKEIMVIFDPLFKTDNELDRIDHANTLRIVTFVQLNLITKSHKNNLL